MDRNELFFAFIGFLAGAVVFMCLVAHIEEAFWKSKAIEHGAAYYHPETGAFTWKEQETKE